MRTTIDLPDELVRAARVRAAEGDETLKERFTRALVKELGRPRRRERRELPVIASKRPGASAVTAEELEQILADGRRSLLRSRGHRPAGRMSAH